MQGNPPFRGPHLVSGASTMASERPPLTNWYAPGFSDALGDRLLLFDNTESCNLEMLRLRAHLTFDPEFEAALRRQVRVLGSFAHVAFAPVYSIDSLEASGGALAIVTAHTSGLRLSEVLNRAALGQYRWSLARAFLVIRRVTHAIAALQVHINGVAHGALGPERIVLAPDGTVTVVDHVLGPSLESLAWDHDRIWSELRLATVHDSKGRRFGPRTDALQIGLVALAAILGRNLDEAYPHRIDELLAEVAQTLAISKEVSTAALVTWIARALQRTGETSFASAGEAAAALGSWHPESSDVSRPLLLEPAETQRPHRSSPQAPMLPARTLLGEPGEIALAAGRPWPRVAVFAAVALLVVVVGAMTGRAMLASVDAVVTVNTVPAGAMVSIDGHAVGVTPLRQSLSSGQHVLEVARDGVTRRISLDARSNTESSHYLEFPVPAAALPPGKRPDVTTAAAESSLSPVVDAAPAADVRSTLGSVIVSSQVPVDVFRAGRLVGTSGPRPLTLPAGFTELELVNRDLEFRTMATVDVRRGERVTLAVALPRGTMNINAQPWADVYVDGARMGETPLGNISLPIGSHRIVLQHPELGSMSHDAVVKVGGVTHVTADLRR